MKGYLPIVCAVIAFTCLLALGIWWQVTVYGECLADHSVMYCFSLVSHR